MPSARGEGRCVASSALSANSPRCSPSMTVRSPSASRTTSAIAYTSVQGPIAPGPIVELLRRPVRRREHPHVPDGPRRRPDRDRGVGQDLGDPEVEDLELDARRGAREKQVAGVEIAMHDALRVRVRQSVDGRIEQRDDLAQRPPVQPGLAPIVELLRQRLSLEPLEHGVRDERARRPGRSWCRSPRLRTMCRLPWESLY